MPSSFEDLTPSLGSVPSHSSSGVQIPAVGSLLADGRYEVTEVLGQGGMSTVLGAFDHELERPVALKVLHDAGGESALLDEARMMGAAQSSDVVAVFALHLENVPPFLVMERVYGIALDRMLATKQPSFREGMRVLAKVAHALDGLHARSIAHGDVKAGNVLVERDGHVKLADLGITPLLRRAAAGDVVGTPTYMPPERARGIVISPELHVRGDVYSFGVLAFVVLAGRPPFVATSPHELLRAHAAEPPPELSSVSELSPSLDAAIAAALEKDPQARTASAGEVMRTLERDARGVDVHGRRSRVLVVDDDASHRELHSRVLSVELHGAEVSAAEDADEALARISAEPPSVLVVDLAMPGTSGLTLLERVHRTHPSIRAVVVTGQGSGKERQHAATLGVRHFLIKPVDPRELSRCVCECIEA